MNLYKVVVRDKNGKVLQIHEVYGDHVKRYVITAANQGLSATVTKLPN